MLPNADAVEAVVVAAYESQLHPASGKPRTAEGEATVVAAIVVRHRESGEMRVAALGTGTRSVGAVNVADQRFVLADCHAEVLCRRAFLSLLVAQAEALLLQRQRDPRSFNLLEVVGEEVVQAAEAQEGRRRRARFRFRSDAVELIMYVSQAPCGAAAILPSSEGKGAVEAATGAHRIVSTPQCAAQEGDMSGTTVVLGHRLATHAADLANHDGAALRVKPGRGAPTLSMCCSDKLLRWQTQGLQGAVVGLILTAPIFIDCFVVSQSGTTDAARFAAALAVAMDRVPAPRRWATVLACAAQPPLPWLPAGGSSSRPCGSSIAAFAQKFEWCAAHQVCGVDSQKGAELEAKRARNESSGGALVQIVLNSKVGVPLGLTAEALRQAAGRPSAELLRNARLITPITRLSIASRVAAVLAAGSPSAPAASSYQVLKQANEAYVTQRDALTGEAGPLRLWVAKKKATFDLSL